MIDIMSDSSEFLNGAKLEKYTYNSINLPYLQMSVGISVFTNEYLKKVIGSLVQFNNISVEADSSNVINVLAVHLADGVVVTKGDQTICKDSRFVFISN